MKIIKYLSTKAKILKIVFVVTLKFAFGLPTNRQYNIAGMANWW